MSKVNSLKKMNNIDIKLLIDEVRKRQSLWDTSGDEHSKLPEQARQWEDLCIAMIPDFNQLNPSDKLHIGLEMQKKWTNIRMYLKRSLKDRGKRTRPYIYEKNLSFLNLTTKQSSRLARNDAIDSDSKDDDQCSDASLDGIGMATQAGRSSNLSSETKFVSQKESNTGDKNDDIDFFRSLLPLIEPLPLRRKLRFRMEAMKKVLEFTENDEPRPSDTLPPPPEPSTSGVSTTLKKRSDVGSPTLTLIKGEECDISDDDF
ncbi:uncharacterized protein LOC131684030 [Topomyia yanbarensis]|uniref:uncharacterized protein LOC131684030 n=1 Tax=Topomyia yanbarensis TaxID=2498891 RepID=UPI00273C0B64|nr:uncharacterized protein LOC131684030 [Topomyia yanbarensis]